MALGAMRTATAMLVGAQDEESSFKPTMDVQIGKDRPDDSVANWNQNLDDHLPVYRLCGACGEEWHEENLTTEGWYDSLEREPRPVAQLANSENQLCGIIHMRRKNDQSEVCLSLVTPKGVWQTGVWIQTQPGDDIGVSWCTDYRGREISAISLELMRNT